MTRKNIQKVQGIFLLSIISLIYSMGAFYTMAAKMFVADLMHQNKAPIILASTIPGGTSWNLIWSDEFEEGRSSGLDLNKWVIETGGNGWGNSELQTYTDRPANLYFENGSLVIKANKETYKGKDGIVRDYTSARLKTKGKFAQKYGRFEARIHLPEGQGLWPAFWMLGENIDIVGWPNCGEIDIMEHIGREPSVVHGTIHGPGYSGNNGIGAKLTLSSGRESVEGYHIFAVEWEPETVRWLVDGKVYQTIRPADLPRGKKWVFDHAFFLVLNVAVGGNWPGNPNSITVFPQKMLVDYVRVYEHVR